MKESNKNIVFLLRVWPFFGGGETVTISLANEFARRNYGVHVLCFKYTDSKNALDIDNRIRVQLVEGVDCDETHANEQDSHVAYSFVLEYIKENKIDIVINQWWPVSYIKNIISESTALVVKCNHTALHHPGDINWGGIKGLVKRLFKKQYIHRLEKRSISEVDTFLPYVHKYVFLSDRFVEQYFQFARRPQNKQVIAIPNPLPFNYNTPFVYNEHEKIDEVLFVGRMVDSLKRLSITLNAWVEVEKQESLNNWKLVVVGDGPDLDSLKEKSKMLGLKRVLFEGFQKPEQYYKRAKVLVQNSKFEGFGMTIIEAQHFGCVPVAMDTFLTVHDLIKNNENGVIVDDNQNSFTTSLLEIMKDNAKRKRMAYSAIESSSCFNIDNICDKWECLFK